MHIIGVLCKVSKMSAFVQITYAPRVLQMHLRICSRLHYSPIALTTRNELKKAFTCSLDLQKTSKCNQHHRKCYCV